MRALAALLALPALLAAVSFDEFIANYTLPGEIIQSQLLASAAGAYALVFINSRESMLVDVSPPGAPSLVESAHAIESVLREDALLSLSLPSRAADAALSLDDFNASGAGWQALCSQWTGTDRFPCVNLSSCQLACISVPLCKNMMMGIGDPFTLSIWGWRNETGRLDFSLSQARSDLSLLPASEEPRAPLSSAQASLSGARSAFHAMRSSDLFNCDPSYPRSYCFCNITFNEAYLNDAEEKLASLEADLSVLDVIPARAAAIADETSARIRAAVQRGEEANFNRTLAAAVAWLAEAEANASEALSLISDENLSLSLERARSKLSEMRSAGAAGDFERGNAVAGELFALVPEIEAEANRLITIYRSLQNASANASAEIALANLTLLPGDGPLFAQLENLSLSLNSTRFLLTPPISRNQTYFLSEEFARISQEAGGIRAKALSKHALEDEAASLALRLSNLSLLAASYNQRLDSTRFTALLSQASLQLTRIELAEANASLSSAEAELASIESSLRRKILQIEAAKAAIAEAEEAVENASRVRVLLFLTPNLEDARAKLNSSRAVLYDDPAIARELADLAHAKADSEAERVQGMCPLAFLLALLLLLAAQRDKSSKRERN
ncbi:MAG: hypothetical protein QXH27_03810 [Candidatus Micrarchaeia archaeon]